MSRPFTVDGDGGTITVTPGALTQVVVAAAEEVDGVRVRRPRRGIDVEVDDDRAAVAVELAVRYGLVVPEVAHDVQQRVAAALARTCGFASVAVDVTVEELDE